MRYLILSIFFIGNTSWAQGQAVPSGPQSIVKTGSLLDLKVIPGEKKIEVYFVGKNAAAIDWAQSGLNAFINIGSVRKTLKVQKGKNSFVVTDLPKPRPELIEFEATQSATKETFKIDLK